MTRPRSALPADHRPDTVRHMIDETNEHIVAAREAIARIAELERLVDEQRRIRNGHIAAAVAEGGSYLGVARLLGDAMSKSGVRWVTHELAGTSHTP